MTMYGNELSIQLTEKYPFIAESAIVDAVELHEDEIVAYVGYPDVQRDIALNSLGIRILQIVQRDPTSSLPLTREHSSGILFYVTKDRSEPIRKMKL